MEFEYDDYHAPTTRRTRFTHGDPMRPGYTYDDDGHIVRIRTGDPSRAEQDEADRTRYEADRIKHERAERDRYEQAEAERIATDKRMDMLDRALTYLMKGCRAKNHDDFLYYTWKHDEAMGETIQFFYPWVDDYKHVEFKQCHKRGVLTVETPDGTNRESVIVVKESVDGALLMLHIGRVVKAEHFKENSRPVTENYVKVRYFPIMPKEWFRPTQQNAD